MADYSYFSPNAPSSATQPSSAQAPVITASISSKRHAIPATSAHTATTTTADTLHQFALHIPAPPAKLVLPVRHSSASPATAVSSSVSSVGGGHGSAASSVPSTPTTTSGGGMTPHGGGHPHHHHPHHLAHLNPHTHAALASAPSQMGGYPRQPSRAPSLSLGMPLPASSATSPYPSSSSTTTSTTAAAAPTTTNAPLTSTSGSRPTPRMTLQSSTAKHSFSVLLPPSIAPEMVTISANKGDRLRVVADAWHVEEESHYEWQISFPPYDIDMSAVHARFDSDGRLTIDVRRRAKIY